MTPGGPWVTVGPADLRTVLSDPLGTVRVRLAPEVDGQPDPVRALVAGAFKRFAESARIGYAIEEDYARASVMYDVSEWATETAEAVLRGDVDGMTQLT